MSKKWNIINNIIVIALTLGLVIAVIFIGRNVFNDIGMLILYFIVGAILSALVNTFIHELGHLIFGKMNGFRLSSIAVWFFKVSRENNKLKFSFILPREEAGYTEMIPNNVQDMKKGYKNMTFGGVFFSLLMMLLSIIPLFFISKLSTFVYGILAINVSISGYYFFGNVLPMINEGVRNDGLTLLSLKRNEDSTTVLVGLLKIQQELNAGKSPAEIDRGLYFDLPQLPEDDMVFGLLLESRFCYYLDAGDIENAVKTIVRLQSVVDYMPGAVQFVIGLHALYSACTINYNEAVADDKMFEYEKYLNKINNAQNIRTKLSYLLYVEKETNLEVLNMFYDKGVRECKKCALSGVGKMELKLLEKIKADFPLEQLAE